AWLGRLLPWPSTLQASFAWIQGWSCSGAAQSFSTTLFSQWTVWVQLVREGPQRLSGADFVWQTLRAWWVLGCSHCATWPLFRALESQRAAFVAAHPAQARLLPDLLALGVALCWLVLVFLLIGLSLRRLRRRLWHRPEVLFFPDKTGAHVTRICSLMATSKRRVWLAMFTLTNDTLSDELLRAHRRGLDVRVILDDEQCQALGADAQRLLDAGVPLVTDGHWARMHHKFALLDGLVLNGSFNWTKQASVANWENLCVLRDSAVVQPFDREFRRMWWEFQAKSKGSRNQQVVSRKRDATPPPKARSQN
ncbi:unnamed protein product, partial [Polarella glacialis]